MMPLAKIRQDLSVAPSPDPAHPGLFLRDHFRYSDAWIIVPPGIVPALNFFDGARTTADLEHEVARLTGDPNPAALAAQLTEMLDKAGFLDNANFHDLRQRRHEEFAANPVRSAVHAGSGYPQAVDELHRVLAGYLAGAASQAPLKLRGIAAPHVSPGGGWESYGAAYRELTPDLKDRTFIILGTSHFGQPNRFGLTRKGFQTPFGTTTTNPKLLAELATQPAVVMEDYCQAIEHSIEFQVVFLQHLYGADVKVLPLLCGPFFASIYNDGNPEDDDLLKRFFAGLAEIAERNKDEVFFVLGVDMAHIGARYGDQVPARANEEHLVRVGERDQDRITSLIAGNAHEFWAKIREGRDDLRWCGSSPMYTFLQAVPQARGTLQRYEQWNIDPQSVVSFAGVTFA